jgi:hypothetical protein
MVYIFYLLCWLAGPALGYFIANKRGGSATIGIVAGILTGPCLGAILIPFILNMFDGRGTSPALQKGAGRSFGVDENPSLGDQN